MIENLLNNLHPAINKDPVMLDAISISGDGVILIKDTTMQLIGASSAQFNLQTLTLSTLADSINSVSGFSATCIAPSTLSATVLLSGRYQLPYTLQMFTSFLWQVLKPVAVAMLNALNAQNNSLVEAIINTSDGSWLDLFGEVFQVTRLDGEPDQLYAIRIFNLSFGTRTNEIAIEKALKDLQYDATITSSESLNFTVNIAFPTSPPQGFIYSYDQMRQIIDLLKPSGVSYMIQTSGTFSDTLVVSDSISVTKSTGPVKYGSGRKWGNGIWNN